MVEGGGEKNGIEGIVVGIVGMEGSEVAGNGGRVTCGTVVGMVGMFMLGSGGKVDLGRDGIVGNWGMLPWGIVGIEGKGGSVGLGKVGIFPWGNVGNEGKGGNVAVGKVGMPGKFGVVVCKRWRAARLMLMLEKVSARRKTVIKDLLDAIAEWIARMKRNGEVLKWGNCFEIVWEAKGDYLLLYRFHYFRVR